jgi:phosphocarrier protein
MALMVTAERTLEITNRAGLHARAAALLVQCAARSSARIMIEKDGEIVNGKSIMGVMMLAAVQGSVITVRADGVDAIAAIAAIADLVERKFDEE